MDRTFCIRNHHLPGCCWGFPLGFRWPIELTLSSRFVSNTIRSGCFKCRVWSRVAVHGFLFSHEFSSFPHWKLLCFLSRVTLEHLSESASMTLVWPMCSSLLCWACMHLTLVLGFASVSLRPSLGIGLLTWLFWDSESYFRILFSYVHFRLGTPISTQRSSEVVIAMNILTQKERQLSQYWVFWWIFTFLSLHRYLQIFPSFHTYLTLSRSRKLCSSLHILDSFFLWFNMSNLDCLSLTNWYSFVLCR